jgi:hypothetical protein
MYAASFGKTYHKQYKEATCPGDGVKNINNRKVGYLNS